MTTDYVPGNETSSDSLPCHLECQRCALFVKRKLLPYAHSLTSMDIWANESLVKVHAPTGWEPEPKRRGKPKKIPVADPGSSYNPDEIQRTAAIAEALAIARQKQCEEEDFVVRLKMLRRNANGPTNPLSGEACEIDYDIDDTNEVDDKPLRIGAPVRAEDRLTKSQRNKKKRNQATAFNDMLSRTAKRKIKDINSVSMLLKSIKREENAPKKQKGFGRLRLGPKKFEDPIPEVLYIEETGKSLRSIVPKGSLVADAYRNFQRQGVIECRSRTNKKVGKSRLVNRWK